MDVESKHALDPIFILSQKALYFVSKKEDEKTKVK